MSRQSIQKAYDCMTPSPAAKVRMLNNILAQADKQKRVRPRLDSSIKRIALVAAVNALVIALSVTAYTAGWLDGRQSSLFLRQPEIPPVLTPLPAETPFIPKEAGESGLDLVSMGLWEYDVGFGQTAIGEFISLQGFKGNPEYEAAKEWQDFLAGYDQNGALRAAHSGSNLDEAYKEYGCYTREMTEKIDEICEKYSLSMLIGFSTHDTTEEFLTAAKTGAFFSTQGEGYENDISTGYTYADGSFHIEGALSFTGPDALWPAPINYQIIRSVKGSFSGLNLKIDSAADYDVWEYKTEDGTELILALRPDHALVIADLEESFVVINHVDFTYIGDVLHGEQPMSRETWEAFADSFDFSAIP